MAVIPGTNLQAKEPPEAPYGLVPGTYIPIPEAKTPPSGGWIPGTYIPRIIQGIELPEKAAPKAKPATAAKSSPRFHCTGPVYAWVSFPGNADFDKGINLLALPGKAKYLGTCEQFPTQNEEVAYVPVFDDKSTMASPRDREYAGSSELIVLPLNRFDYKVLDIVLSVPRYGRATEKKAVEVAGANDHMDRGSLAISQGLFFSLWLINSYYGQTPWITGFNDMPGGTYYPFCTLAGNQTPKQGTGNTQVRMIAVDANWYYYERTGEWFLKSSEMKYLEKCVP